MLKNRTPIGIEQAVVALAINQPAWGQVRVSEALKRRRLSISPTFCRGTGDRAAKSRARGASPAAQPLSSFLLCGAHARLWPPWVPVGNKARVSGFGLLDPAPFLIALALDVVGVRRSFCPRAAW
jgi:hypothetical protein